MSDSTTPMYHPTLESVEVQVDKKKVDDWTEQGWRKTPLTKSSAASAGADQSGNDTEGK